MLNEPIVITGIGLVASVAKDRETVWRAVQRGQSNFRFLRGMRGIPDDEFVGGTVEFAEPLGSRLKVFPICELAADEAVRDARIDFDEVDLNRFACVISGHMGDSRWIDEQFGLLRAVAGPQIPWWEQMFPDSACSLVARRYHLGGPRLCHSTACASSLISVLAAKRMIVDDQCDIALAGGGDAIDPLFVAGFDRMRVLAKDPDPNRACRPFDRTRKGFVFGEGGALFVIERLSHALRRGARVYAEIAAATALAQAHHVTSLDADSDSLDHLIHGALDQAGLRPHEIGYVNAHGTGTEQNDLAEARAIRHAFGDATVNLCVSATKSILGHMIHAAGAVELAITALALRDGFAPPTLNLTDPDPECTFDCLPLVGRVHRCQNALKLSLAFGGHLVAVVLRRWNDAATGFEYPSLAKAACEYPSLAKAA